jgi:hypothetical protein
LKPGSSHVPSDPLMIKLELAPPKQLRTTHDPLGLPKYR